MKKDETWAHAPGLLIFYAVEYFILGTYLPDWAPWIAIASIVVLVLVYMKVLVYDLAGSPAPVRIGTLVVLGISLYLGGWLYQKLAVGEECEEEVALSSAGSG
jgi:uncharacterized membrane protein